MHNKSTKKTKFKDLSRPRKVLAIILFSIFGFVGLVFLINTIAVISEYSGNDTPVVTERTAAEVEQGGKDAAFIHAKNAVKDSIPDGKVPLLVDSNTFIKAAPEGWQDIPDAQVGWRTYEVQSWVEIDGLKHPYIARVALNPDARFAEYVVYYFEDL